MKISGQLGFYSSLMEMALWRMGHDYDKRGTFGSEVAVPLFAFQDKRTVLFSDALNGSFAVLGICL